MKVLFGFLVILPAIFAAGSTGYRFHDSKEKINPFADRLTAHKHLMEELYKADKIHEETNRGVNWAVIVAGSNGWYNYRHQADVCHAYQIFHSHGIPDERIIVFMYDDLARNVENPTPGIVINQPDGDDVYNGVLHDYVGDDVTPENFLAVLQGDSEGVRNVGSGRVLESGPNDHVFVNFADHGAPGLIAFPYDVLTSTALNRAIKNMNARSMYKQMAFYIEACESGSMFEGILPENINVYATTASNAEESSYACYYDDARGTYLGDVYSVKWMEDTDAHDINSETLDDQYRNVKKETDTSHVMEYGNLTMGTTFYVGEFQGDLHPEAPKVVRNVHITDAVPQGDAPLVILKNRLASAQNPEDKARIEIELDVALKRRQFIVDTVHAIVQHAGEGKVEDHEIISSRRPLTDRECYESVVGAFHEKCFNLGQTDYALRHLYNFVNLCESGITAEEITHSIERIC